MAKTGIFIIKSIVAIFLTICWAYTDVIFASDPITYVENTEKIAEYLKVQACSVFAFVVMERDLDVVTQVHSNHENGIMKQYFTLERCAEAG